MYGLRSVNLVIHAGPSALTTLRGAGFDRDCFSALVGASGGPKWLVLSQLDRVLCEHLLPDRRTPLAMLGSSIGAFRHACFAQRDPVAALERFETAYIGQAYEREPMPAEVTAASRRILAVMLGETGRDEILSNPQLSTYAVAVRSRAAVSTERRLPLLLGLGAAAIGNAVARPLLGIFFERTLFHCGDAHIRFRSLRTRRVRLDLDNLDAVLLASGSIPLVMSGVSDVAGAPPGVYRDGGIVDYHFDFAFDAGDGLILYPHFFERIVPGWFDKGLPWRRPRPADLDRVVMIAPSADFIARLPGGKVPDRSDFRAMATADRQRVWRGVIDACRPLADELTDLIMTSRLAARATPFP